MFNNLDVHVFLCACVFPRVCVLHLFLRTCVPTYMCSYVHVCSHINVILFSCVPRCVWSYVHVCYFCSYVHVYVDSCVPTYMCVPTWMWYYLHVFPRACGPTCMCVPTCICSYLHVFLLACVRSSCVPTCTCTYMHVFLRVWFPAFWCSYEHSFLFSGVPTSIYFFPKYDLARNEPAMHAKVWLSFHLHNISICLESINAWLPPFPSLIKIVIRYWKIEGNNVTRFFKSMYDYKL